MVDVVLVIVWQVLAEPQDQPPADVGLTTLLTSDFIQQSPYQVVLSLPDTGLSERVCVELGPNTLRTAISWTLIAIKLSFLILNLFLSLMLTELQSEYLETKFLYWCLILWSILTIIYFSVSFTHGETLTPREIALTGSAVLFFLIFAVIVTIFVLKALALWWDEHPFVFKTPLFQRIALVGQKKTRSQNSAKLEEMNLQERVDAIRDEIQSLEQKREGTKQKRVTRMKARSYVKCKLMMIAAKKDASNDELDAIMKLKYEENPNQNEQ
eukprot:TRINITY_DN10884_c0_g1_i10.p1 TRINITY_DN10884_c0_g1~~TRINITY_DN10884_c0_g1_i10.p1  ORF type:complete len:269 (+),score=47.83 TRINITY_DN10884_c0_g1_i10:110-916(+)